MSAALHIEKPANTKPNLRVVQKARRRFWARAAEKTTVFCVIALASFVMSTLMGQTMMEKARREGIQATVRARDAKAHVAMLRERVSRLSSVREIEAWAQLNGMTSSATEALRPAKPEPTRVASR